MTSSSNDCNAAKLCENTKWRCNQEIEGTETIPERVIVACGPFYEVDFFLACAIEVFASVFTQAPSVPVIRPGCATDRT